VKISPSVTLERPLRATAKAAPRESVGTDSRVLRVACARKRPAEDIVRKIFSAW
jgi:hypothetical protein